MSAMNVSQRKRLMEIVWGPRPKKKTGWRAVAVRAIASAPKHGTLSMYTNQGCRCDKCRAVNMKYHQQRRTAA